MESKNIKPKILIVDDTPENIMVLKRLLCKLDVEILEASSGNEALVQTLYNDFAVIFLDVLMPEMNGYEVADFLKSEDKTAGIPIIFITANDRDNTKELKGYDKGAVDFIFKPFNEFILLNKAKVFLDLYKMRANLETQVANRTADLARSNKRLKEEIRKKASVEQDLIKVQTYLSSILNSISSILIGTDTKGSIEQMNMEAEKFCAFPRKTTPGKSVYEAFPSFALHLKDLIGKGSQEIPLEKNNIQIIHDGRNSIFNFAVFPLIGTQSEQVVIRIDDVTESKLMESELHRRRHMESLGQLAGGVAHDFNNMLSAIMGAAEILKIKLATSPEYFRPINSILTSVERAADLTNKLLSCARQKGSGKNPVDIHRLIKETVSILQRSIDKRIRIVVQLSAAGHIVTGDESELSNALLNLAINARDAMPEGGELQIITNNSTITQHSREQTKLDLQRGEYIQLTISDTGTGMSDEIMGKAFDPFFTTKEPGRGTGLGLASVYGTIKSHDGTISVESILQQGSSFTIFLPVSEEVSRKKDLAPRNNSQVTLSGTVLLVDDEDIIRTVGSELLRELGLEVLTAENGRHAIDIAKSRKSELSLILLDMIMPEMNGTDCYREIRKILPNIRIIICSGYAPEEMFSKIRLEGLYSFLQKPYRIEQLQQAIKSSLQGQ